MNIKNRIEGDLKQAMLAGDKQLVSVLRGIKSVILSAEVDRGKRDSGLEEGEVISLLAKEAKKRREVADLYEDAGDADRANAELAEKAIIEKFLPEQVTPQKISVLVDEVIKDMGREVSVKDTGEIIGKVRQKAGPGADGATAARLVREKLA